MRSILISVIFLLITQFGLTITQQDQNGVFVSVPEDGKLSFHELATKRGLKYEKHRVTTEDGYIITAHRIPGDPSKPVYIQHGFLDSSDSFILVNVSIITFLASERYDIWVGNMRGNKYSKRHVTLSPKDPEFWDFSFHDIGMYDVAATIDYILEHTGQTQLQAIGYSLGTTVFYVLGCMRPEYNDKIKVFISLAPVAFLRHVGPSMLSLLTAAENNGAASLLSPREFMRDSSDFVRLLRDGCNVRDIGYTVCSEGLFYPAFGYDPEQFNLEIMQLFLAHYPAGSSLKNALHVFQLTTGGRFAQYNYGYMNNLIKYQSAEAPDYDLSKFVAKTAIVVGLNDRSAVIEDVDVLKNKLPNVVDYHVMEFEQWNHLDFICGKYMPKYLFGYLLDILVKYY